MIENYVHWNEDIGEWQLVSPHRRTAEWKLDLTSMFFLELDTESCTNFKTCLFASQKCVAYTGNNMRKQTPAPDKKEKDVSSSFSVSLRLPP